MIRPVRSRLVRGRNLAVVAGLHVCAAAGLVAGPAPRDWVAFAVFYLAGAVALGVGLHRYFAHHAFATGRATRLVLGAIAGTAFTDPISFAGRHRIHHRHADTERDIHGPHQGLWQSWIGSMLDDGLTEAEVAAAVPDLMTQPDLVWLRRWYWVPPLVAAALTALGGFTMFALAFCLSRVVIIHSSAAVNWFGHRGGARPHATRDRSANHRWLALLTLGEGWHNNHHRFPSSARAGLHPGEPDPLYWLIRLMERCGLVWSVRLS